MGIKTHKHFGFALVLLLIFFSCAYAGGVDSSGSGTQWLLALLVAAVLGSLQSLCLFILVSMRADNKDEHAQIRTANNREHAQLWTEVRKHGHAIVCDKDGCKPKTVAL